MESLESLESLKDLFILDMITKCWTRVRTNDIPHERHSLTAVSENRVILVGGENHEEGLETGLKTVRLFDLKSGAWTEEDSLPDPLRHHRSVAVKGRNGISVVCVGGVGNKIACGGWCSPQDFWSKRFVIFNFE